jgi:hypothetical protein
MIDVSTRDTDVEEEKASFYTHPLSLERRSAFKGTPLPLPQEMLPERQQEEQRSHALFDSSEWLNVDEEEKDFYTQPLSLETKSAAKPTSAPPLREYSPERTKEKQKAHGMLGAPPLVTVDECKKQDSKPMPISLVSKSAVEVSPPPLPRESSAERQQAEHQSHELFGSPPWVNIDEEDTAFHAQPPFFGACERSPERTKKAQQAHEVLGVPPQVSDDDEEEDEREVFDTHPLPPVTRSAGVVTPPPLHRESSPERTKEAQQAHTMLVSSPRVIDDEEVEREGFDSEPVPLEMRSALDIRPPRDMPCAPRVYPDKWFDTPPLSPVMGSSVEATTPRVSGDEEKKDDFDTHKLSRVTGGTAKRVSFCTSPPQVRKFQRYNTGRVGPLSPIQTDNFNKKRRQLKKNLAKLSGSDEESLVLDQGVQAMTSNAVKLALTVLVVNLFVLTQRR